MLYITVITWLQVLWTVAETGYSRWDTISTASAAYRMLVLRNEGYADKMAAEWLVV